MGHCVCISHLQALLCASPVEYACPGLREGPGGGWRGVADTGFQKRLYWSQAASLQSQHHRFLALRKRLNPPNFLLPLCQVRAALLGYWDEAETKSARPRAWRVVSSLHQWELLFSKQGCVYAVATSCFSRERGAHFALDTDSPFPAARLTTAPLI